MNGETVIAARQVDCDDDDATFALAVKENVTHGLPLSLADRKAAAASIIASCPQWSDRVVAECAGLSDKTVSALRAAGSAAESLEQNSRLGKDGRLRPLNTAAMRRKAATMLTDQPGAGLREIARATGLSPGTVGDVRRRIDRGEDPVPARYSDMGEPDSAGKTRRLKKRADQAKPVNLTALLAELMNDPSLKFSKSGRRVLRWLDHYPVNEKNCQGLAKSIPDHWALRVAELARSCAAAWITLAEDLERRAADGHARAPSVSAPGPTAERGS